MAGTLSIEVIDVVVIVAYLCAILALNWFRKHHLGDDQ